VTRDSASLTGRSLAASALFLLAAWAAFLWPILGQGGVPIYRDILHTTFPLGSYIGARLRAGELPQWFPLEGLGEPFIGQLNESAFHPSSWLYAVLSPIAALRWQLLLGYAAAALGQLLYARRLGLGAAAALLSAVAFAFSGYAVSLSNLVPYLWGMATLPWIGLCAAGIARGDAPWRWVGALAALWATVVVAGDSHSPLFAGIVVLFTFAVLGGVRRLPLAVIAGLLALGVAAAELLPAIAIVEQGPRAVWNRVSTLSGIWALHPYRLPELLVPGWMPGDIGREFGAVRYREGTRWAFSIYLGAPAAALALTGILSRTRRGLAAGLLALAALWLALGVHGGLEPFLRRALPMLNFLRYPEKHLGLFTFAASLAAGAGLDHARRARSLRLPLALGAAAVAAAAAALLMPAGLPLRIWPPLGTYPNWVAELQAAWRAGLFATALWLSVAGALLFLARRQPRVIWLLPAALVAELWGVNAKTVAIAPPEVLTALPRFCARALREGAGPAGFRVLSAITVFPQYASAEMGVSWAARQRNLLEADDSSLCGIGSMTAWGNLSNEPRAVRRMLGDENLAQNPRPAIFGFGLVVRSQRPNEAAGEVIVDGVGGTYPYILVRRPAAARAYAAVPRWVPDQEAAFAELGRGLALTDSPVLTGETPPSWTADPGPAGAAGAVRIVEYAPERVVLEAHMERAGAVVLNDLFAEGWTATLDGAPVRLYPANMLARGMLVPRGEHRIEMRYQLPRLREGLFVSASSLAACLGLALFARGRRSAAEPAGAAEAEHALQREYWAEADHGHFRWQTENEYIAATENALLDRVRAAEGERLLEIGCGEGANLRNLRQRLDGARVFAVDFSPPKVRFASQGGARGACADAASLPFADRAFDAVLIRDLLHHVPDRAGVLREATRVLRLGGRLTLIEPNGRNPIIAAMALGIRAERGMLSSSAARALEEAQQAGLVELSVEPRQPLPLSRVFLHYRLGAPSLARFAGVRALLRALEAAAAILPRSLWSYFVLSGSRRA
jgi:SAM-dependent methyltransferase